MQLAKLFTHIHTRHIIPLRGTPLMYLLLSCDQLNTLWAYNMYKLEAVRKSQSNLTVWKLSTSDLADISNMALHRPQFFQDFYKKRFKFGKWRLIKLIDCIIYHVFHYKLSQISRFTFELELIFILGWHFPEKIAITEPKMLTFYNTESIKNQNKGRFCQIWRVLLALTISNLIGYAKFEV